MSTRGYLTIIDEEKNIQMAAFYPSSAYPSYLGLQVLDAIENSSFPQFIDRLQKEYPDELDMVKGIERDWYIKGDHNKNEFFHDYAYELNSATQVLSVYHYGDKELTIKPEQIPLYRFIFENEDHLYYPLCFDERSMTLKKDYFKEIRNMVKKSSGKEEFQKIIDDNPSILYMEQYREKDPWYRSSDSFNKRVYDSASHRQLKFCVDESFGKFHIYIQTPFIRAPISDESYRSVTASEKAIAALLRDRPEDVCATMYLFHELASYCDKMKAIFQNDTTPLDEREKLGKSAMHDMLASLNEIQSERHILGNADKLFEREIRDTVSINFTRAKRRLEENEKKPTLAETIKGAETRAGENPSGGKRSSISSIEIE